MLTRGGSIGDQAVGDATTPARRLRALEDENRRLKRLLAESMLDNAALKDLLGKNVRSLRRKEWQ